jgi:hypothetical protein
VPLPSYVFSGNPAGFPSNRGGFLIADSCNFAVPSEYRTPVHFVPWRSSVFPGQGLRADAHPDAVSQAILRFLTGLDGE